MAASVLCPFTIKWVDDDRRTIRSLVDRCRSEGFNVDVERSPVAALEELARDGSCDIAFADLLFEEVPDFNGLNLIESVNEARKVTGLPVLIWAIITNFLENYIQSIDTSRYLFVQPKKYLRRVGFAPYRTLLTVAGMDHRIRSNSPEVMEMATRDSVDASHFRRKELWVGYVFRYGEPESQVLIWQLGHPSTHQLRWFATTYLADRGITSTGTPLRIGVFDGGKEGTLTVAEPLGGEVVPQAVKLVHDLDYGLFE